MRSINVFIGGSSEALKVAKKVKELIELSGDINCTIWNQAFEFNHTFLRSLQEACYTFDFGILIASKDDVALIRQTVKDIPRDNIIFEYGLFLGSLGNNRTLLVQEKGANLPTDLQGYTTPRYDLGYTEKEWENLGEGLVQAMRNQFQKSEIQALPSTALAIGYFNSFLQPVAHYTCNCESGLPLLNKNKFEHREAKIFVVLPQELSSNISAKATRYYSDRKYTPDGIGSSGRPFPIRFYRDADNLVIVDMPTTLNAVRPAVNLLFPDTGIGINPARQLVEKRELENFKKTLEYLISQDDYSKGLVEVTWEN
tara:strand:- start:36836 stop:37771 length:936 start_codon:yes stop_codon:yes gene_type:complete